VNSLLQNPSYVPVWQEHTEETAPSQSAPQASSSSGQSACVTLALAKDPKADSRVHSGLVHRPQSLPASGSS
jgi:hypothetical protein